MESIERLVINNEKIQIYMAGLPNFPRNFTRDSIISSILMRNPKMLKSQLIFCAKKQGKKKNHFTGEEPGKIFHEYPRLEFDGLSTEYNACDTTALFLIGHFYYKKWTNDDSLIKLQKNNIHKAIRYIISHLNNSLFYEDPKFSGAKRFCLKVTYWKDSEILKRDKGMPAYPIIYFLAHIQNMAALRISARLLNSKKLNRISEKMRFAIQKLWNENPKNFYIAVDKKGSIAGINSDFLHSLFYLEKGDLTLEQIKWIETSSRELETPIGYLTLSKKFNVKDSYHSRTVWPFEQAIINIGAKKFNLKRIEEVSSKIIKVLDTEPEFFLLKNGKIKKVGCDPQLWTIAAKKYFNFFKSKPI